MKKYEFTDQVKNIGGRILHRIRALRDIPEHDIKAGDLGGWLEKGENLSQYGSAWVDDEAMVFGSARVKDAAWVACSAMVFESARVEDSAVATGSARVTDAATVSGWATVSGSAWVADDATVDGRAYVGGMAYVCADAVVTGSAVMTGAVCLADKAMITSSADYTIIGTGNGDDVMTFYRGEGGKIYVYFDDFDGSVERFEQEVKKTYAGTKHEKTYLLAIALAKAQLGTTEEEDKCWWRW